MSKIGLVIILSVLAGKSVAQNYFVFIGADNRQPFYVRLDSQFYSSSPEGHLILSQLQDKDYNMTIGFPGQSSPEQKFRFNINHKDQDFQLRMEDGSWKLYDLQGKQWVMPIGGGVVGDEFRSTGVKKDDAFSQMMAGVVRDTAVLYSTFNSSPLDAAHPAADSPATGTAMTTRPAADSPSTAALTTNPPPVTPPVPTNTLLAAAPDTSLTTRVPAHNDTALAAVVRPDSAVATHANTAIITHPDTAITHPDTSMVVVARTDSSLTIRPAAPVKPAVADTANLLYRPVAGTVTHRSAPKMNSPAAPLYRTASVTKLSERKLAHGLRLVYADHTPGAKSDTVVIIIPVDTVAAPKAPKTTSTIPVRQPHAADTSHLPSRGHGPNADSPTFSQSSAVRPSVPLNLPQTESARPHPDTAPQRRQAKPLPYVNSDCHDFATDYDLDKLREKMLYLTKDDDRITAARKTFKIKCFSTRQIRQLSEVFTTEAAKYRFLEAAWPFAADEHFHELSDLLADPVYISKFKALTHQ